MAESRTVERPSDEIALLREIARWMRELALPTLRVRAAPFLDTDGKRRVYQAIQTGETSVKLIESTTGVNHNDVRAWVRTWEEEGLAAAGMGPPKALFTLRELGIETPPPKATRSAKVAT